jgi:hypothetical protein
VRRTPLNADPFGWWTTRQYWGKITAWLVSSLRRIGAFFVS